MTKASKLTHFIAFYFAQKLIVLVKCLFYFHTQDAKNKIDCNNSRANGRT